MAIQIYQAGSSGGVADAASKTTGVKVDNSGLRANLQQQAGIGKAILAGAKMYMDQMESADLMKASNMYNDKMSELRNSLMENKEENALDNMAKYEEGRNKILEDIYKNGPRSVRGGLGKQKFELNIEKDWIGQKNQMRSYMMQESEKYQDTQTGNTLLRYSQNIAESYSNPMELTNNIEAGENALRERYKYYGAAKQEAAINKWRGQCYGQAIDAALGKDDYDTAGILLQGGGKWLDPKVRTNLDKMISERKRSDALFSDIGSLYAIFGDNKDAAWKQYSARFVTGNGEGVSSAAQKAIGQQLGNNTCAIFASRMVTEAGGDTSLNSTLADGMYVNYEEKGLTYSDRNQLRDGDLVFWSVDGSGYEANNDKGAVNTNTHAYKGITHVGVYNAKTGKVIQSGSHGVSEMDIDTAGYHFVGAARQNSKGLSPTELEKRRREFESAYGGEINRAKAQQNYLCENVANQMLAMYKDGNVHSPKEYEALIYKYTGNNAKMYNSLLPMVSHFAKGGGYHDLSLIERYALEEAIDQGKYSQEELLNVLTTMNVKPEKAMEYVRKNKQAIAKEGKIDWSMVKNAFYEGVGGKDKVSAAQMMGVMTAARRKVEEYTLDPRTKGQQIPMDDLVRYMQDSLLTGDAGAAAGGYGDYSVSDMMRKSIYRIDKRSDGKLDVYFFGSDKPFPVAVTEEQLKERMK